MEKLRNDKLYEINKTITDCQIKTLTYSQLSIPLSYTLHRSIHIKISASILLHNKKDKTKEKIRNNKLSEKSRTCTGCLIWVRIKFTKKLINKELSVK